MSLQVNGNQPATITTAPKAAQTIPNATPALDKLPSAPPMDRINTGNKDDLLNHTAALNEFDINTVCTKDMDKIDTGTMDSIRYEPKTQGRDFKTWGDPHEVTGDGLKFDNQKFGDFVKMQSKSGDLVLQTRHSQVGSNANVKYNTAFALKLSNNNISFDVKNKDKIKLNGEEKDFKPGTSLDLPGGGTISRGADGNISITSAMGDRFNVTVHAQTIDIAGSISSRREDGEVTGSLGTFDADTDTSNDLRDRNGNIMDKNNLDAFLEEWRVKDGESLF